MMTSRITAALIAAIAALLILTASPALAASTDSPSPDSFSGIPTLSLSCGEEYPCCGEESTCCGEEDPCCGEEEPCCGEGCVLQFRAQPANARVDEPISSSPYAPSAAPVSVEVVNDDGDPVPVDGLEVTISLDANPGASVLSGTSTSSTVDGVATFSTLSLNNPGVGYTLRATAEDTTAATSDPFNTDEVAVACEEDVDCAGTLDLKQTNQSQGGASQVTATANQGTGPDEDTSFLTLSTRVGGPLECAGYTELTATLDVVAVNSTSPDRSKYVVARIDKRVMNAVPNNGAGHLESCFGAPFTFATKLGTALEVNSAYVPGPYPAPEYKGLLPDCGKKAQLDDPNTPGVSGPIVLNAGPPCVTKRKKNQGDGIIEARWPSGNAVGFADPRGRF